MNQSSRAIVRRNKRFLDIVKEKGGVNIHGKIVPYVVFEYLQAHPEERMYIGANKSTIDKVHNKALKWQQNNDK